MARRLSLETVITAQDNMSAVLRNVTNQLDGFDKKLKSSSKKSAGWADTMKGMIGANLATSGFRFIKDAVLETENAVASFIPKFGGDMQRAKAFVADLNKVAAETPFEFLDIAKAADMLMGFGVATEKDVIPQMKMLGDLAGGNAQKLNSIALAYSQSMAAGKLNMQDVNQLINAGVPILGELAKMYKVNVGQIRDMISKGQIMSKDTQKAFRNMTSAGGVFFNGMKIASDTTSGKLSTLRDGLKQTAVAVAGPLVNSFQPVILAVGDVANAFAGLPSGIQSGLLAAGGLIAIFAGGVKSKIGGAIAIIGTLKNLLNDLIDTEGTMAEAEIALKNVTNRTLGGEEAKKDVATRIASIQKLTEGTIQYKQAVASLTAAHPELSGKISGESSKDVISAVFQNQPQLYQARMAATQRSAVLSLDEAQKQAAVKIASPLWGKQTGIQSAQLMADMAIKKLQIAGRMNPEELSKQQDYGLNVMARAIAMGDTLGLGGDKTVYQEAFKQKLIDAYKEAQKNQPAPPPQEINIRVSQDGRVTDVQTTKQAATGFKLFSKIAFNP